MADKDKFFNKYYRAFVIPLGFLLYVFVSYIINPFSRYWEYVSRLSGGRQLVELFIALIISWMIAEISLATARWMDKWMPWERQPLKRSITQTIVVLVAVFIALNVLDYISMLLFPPPPEVQELFSKVDTWQFFVVCSLVSILISAVHTGNYFLKRWKNSMLEAAQLQLDAAQLKETAMQAQLQSLKLQLDPHFLFNNFSTLSALIEEDPALATSFLEKLSRVYRYMIANLNSDVISLNQELNFIAAYIFLIDIRHGSNVNISVNVSDANKDKGIPPITLQLLIENAIKHNIASAQQPLYITIYDEGDDLIVKNNIQLIQHTLPSTGLGLENIRKRYALLFEREVAVNDTQSAFQVRLPLVDF
ncbi:sensor histidine kinase [Chitinophaga pinensis]|uniref:Signal transduction histidine kinase, LytS n=1 Tax=Chitinophaga pinensis (strain ATCC 43595 / DSM 2588 / LMG 13176 / NBRC 15968 / NCIMB 11800 / UQM 2034) TaxID=485918 RepID=A0A979GA41_CHIPD|nr:histidine kinase [Chitinophaga pinensis]ACU63512.1 signal transduction histidine kinase, LytS [Chitinophaga pinensis DSM 2588]